jgi:hypothetical protein
MSRMCLEGGAILPAAACQAASAGQSWTQQYLT